MIEHKVYIREYHPGGGGSTAKPFMHYAPFFYNLETASGAKVSLIPSQLLDALWVVAEAARIVAARDEHGTLAVQDLRATLQELRELQEQPLDNGDGK